MKKIIALVVVLAAGIGFWYMIGRWNAKINDPLIKIMREDDTKGVEVSAHYGYFLNPNVLVLDVRGFDKTLDKKDVFQRMHLLMMKYAARVQDFKFKRVVFACRYDPKYQVPAKDFKQIGKEYELRQNTAGGKLIGFFAGKGAGLGWDFPRKVRTLDNQQAFENKLLEIGALSEFHEKWYYKQLTESKK